MLHFQKPTDSPNPYCVVELSDGRKAYESNMVQFWRYLKNFCDQEVLCVKRLYIIDEGGSQKTIKRNNVVCYFIVREGRLSLRSKGQSIKKGYGAICVHPGGITKTYIEWYDDKTGAFIHSEVIRGAQKLHGKVLGIKAT